MHTLHDPRHFVFGHQGDAARGGFDDLLGTFDSVEAARAHAATMRTRLDRTYVASIDAATGNLVITWEPPAPLWYGQTPRMSRRLACRKTRMLIPLNRVINCSKCCRGASLAGSYGAFRVISRSSKPTPAAACITA